MLRPQQLELEKLVIEIENGAKIKDIILAWSVGAGKSLASVILSRLLTDNKKQIVIVPRISLQEQGERTFLSDFYPTNKTARIASNSGDPWRGCDSAFVTFQTICMNPQKWISLFEANDVMLVMDEAHHLSGHGDWIKTIAKLKELSFLTVFMSGSPFRGDNTKIPFLPYFDSGELDCRNTESLKWIIYDSKQALKDGHILPFDTTTIDGSGKYIDREGFERSFDTLGSCGDNLRCVFDSEYAFHFIDLAFERWISHRNKNKYSKMIIVSSSINLANKYCEYIKAKYKSIRTGIATSEDTKLSQEIIKRSKKEYNYYSAIDCLVSVNTAYEGLDIPQCDHMIVLTLIRSLQWITQCFGRCQRKYKDKKKGFVFVPEDERMIRLIKKINAGTIEAANGEPQEEQIKQESDDEEQSRTPRGIEPLESQAHINGIPLFTPPSQSNQKQETQSEKEHRLRREINSVINKIVGSESAGNRKTKQRILFLKIKQQVNSGRNEKGKLITKHFNEMTISDLVIAKEVVESYQ